MLAAAAAVLVAVAVVAVMVIGFDDGGGRTARAVTTVPLDSPVVLDAARDEALALIRKGKGQTYHARYEAAAAAEGFPRSVEVWRRADMARTDTEFAAQGQVERSATVRSPSGVVSCRRVGEEPWSCQKVAATPPENLFDLFDEASVDLAGSEVVARDAEVRGRKGRCFAVELVERQELCFDGDGVLLRLAAADSALELVTKEAAVDPAAVRPPVPPTS